jgi:probable rRNA maturation factor
MLRNVAISMMPGTRGRIATPELRRIARHVLEAEDVAPGVTVEVALADAATSRELNRLYRGRDEPTDVLSFAVSEGEAFLDAPEEAPSLGEIVICVSVVEQQLAGEPSGSAAGGDVEAEIAHLLVHGLLHLLGHDHEQGEAEAQEMQAREDALLLGLGYAGRYAHGDHG